MLRTASQRIFQSGSRNFSHNVGKGSAIFTYNIPPSGIDLPVSDEEIKSSKELIFDEEKGFEMGLMAGVMEPYDIEYGSEALLYVAPEVLKASEKVVKDQDFQQAMMNLPVVQEQMQELENIIDNGGLLAGGLDDRGPGFLERAEEAVPVIQQHQQPGAEVVADGGGRGGDGSYVMSLLQQLRLWLYTKLQWARGEPQDEQDLIARQPEGERRNANSEVFRTLITVSAVLMIVVYLKRLTDECQNCGHKNYGFPAASS